MNERTTPLSPGRTTMGVAGLDRILNGGFLPGQTYLVRGGPGCGKTTFGFHFLAAGPEPGILVSPSEPESQLRRNAANQGLHSDHVHVLDLAPGAESFQEDDPYTVFDPSDVEWKPVADQITRLVETEKPNRVFVDSITQFRYMSPDPYQFRKLILGFMRYITGTGATLLVATEASPEAPDDDIQFLVDGVINVDQANDRRELWVSKFRGSTYQAGAHTLRLREDGFAVFPRLVPEHHARPVPATPLPSGVPELDTMLHGGLEYGTMVVIAGPSGTGKSTLGLQFMKEAAGRGERSVVFLFEERRQTLMERCEAINIPVQAMVDNGTLVLREVEPLAVTADEFAGMVRQEVEDHGARIVMLDSTAGYRMALTSEDLAFHLHALTRYLTNMGVTTLLPNETHGEGNVDSAGSTDHGISYLADTVLILRYIKTGGTFQKCINVLKKRRSDFRKEICTFDITPYGLRVGGIPGGGGSVTEDPTTNNP